MSGNAVKYGILTGAAIIAYMLVFYLADRKYAVSSFVSLSTLVFVVAGMVMACRAERNRNDGNLSRQEALKTSFSVAVVSGLFFYAFIYVLFNFIDPELSELNMPADAERTPGVERAPPGMTIGRVLLGYCFSLIYGFLLSLMVARFMKK